MNKVNGSLRAVVRNKMNCAGYAKTILFSFRYFFSPSYQVKKYIKPDKEVNHNQYVNLYKISITFSATL